jgi:predicted ribosomally synthesized peptide with SipW-like signal peptide
MKNKIGVIFAASVMALAGIGVSFAAFTDTLTAFGTVDVADLSHTVGGFSGTTVWKVWGTGAPEHEVYIQYWPDMIPPENQYPGCQFLSVAQSWAQAGSIGGPDVVLSWQNIFPCIDFKADFDLTYTGDIPVKINKMTITYGANSAWIDAYLSYELTHDGLPVALGAQLHTGDVVHCIFTIHIPQDNALQGLTATGTASLELVQWNEYPYTP